MFLLVSLFNKVKLSAYKEVDCRKVGESYLAYSNLNSETISLSYFAYCMLLSLISREMNMSDLMSSQAQYAKELNSDELLQVLEKTINELVIHGFIYKLPN